MTKRPVHAAFKISAIVATLALASCQERARQQCGEAFCLSGDEFGELRKNPPREDFEFYQSEFRGVPIGIYEGDFPTLPDDEEQIAGRNGIAWHIGCLDEACSIWPDIARSKSPKMFALSVPANERDLLYDIALHVTSK